MGSRIVVVTFLLVVACVPASSRRTPEYREVSQRPASTELPVTPEDRAAEALADLEDFCASRTAECAAHARPSVYPSTDVPVTTAERIDARTQELRTLGFMVRWEPGANRYEIVRGNSPTWSGDPASDP